MSDPPGDPGPDVARIAARCGSDTLRLEPEWPAILHWMRRFGRVVVRTGNRYAVLAQPGRFGRPAIFGARRAFLGGDFALACRLDRWQTIFATIDDAGNRELRIFDVHGDAVETIEVGDPSGRPGFDEMVWRLHAHDQSVEQRVLAPSPHRRARDGRPRLHGDERRATQVRVGFVRALFATLAERRMEISLAVRNAGTIHAHAGRLAAFEGVSRWTAAFVSRARCTIDASSIARAWIVRVPGNAGGHAIELVGEGDAPIVSIGGVAGYDGRETFAWRSLIAGLAPA